MILEWLCSSQVHIGAAVVAEDLHELRLLGAALQRVVGEDLVGVGNALGLLRLRRRTFVKLPGLSKSCIHSLSLTLNNPF